MNSQSRLFISLAKHLFYFNALKFLPQLFFTLIHY